MFIRKPKSLTRRIDVFGPGFTVRFVSPLDFGNPLPNQSVRDNKLRPAAFALLCCIECIEKLLHVVPIDLLDIEPVCLKTLSGVFALRLLSHRVERDRVGIVNQN